MTGSGHPYLTGLSGDSPAQRYGAAGTLPAHQLIVSSDYQLSKKRSFDLAVKKKKQTMKVDESYGWIIRNQFSTRTRVHSYGIVSRMFFGGVIQCSKPGKIFQVQEETIECESLRDGTLFDVYFSWDGMLGTNSKGGGAGFNMSISIAWEDKLKLLSAMDGVRDLGAKNCRDSSRLVNNFVRSKGTRITFVLHYEMNVSVRDTPMSLSELHFEDPVTNYFKIVTR